MKAKLRHLAAPVLVGGMLLQGCSAPPEHSPVPLAAEAVRTLPAPALSDPGDFPAPMLRSPGSVAEAGSASDAAPRAVQPARSDPAEAPATSAGLPGVGPRTMAHVPADSRQLLVSSTASADDTHAGTVLYQRTTVDAPWEETASFPGHNGASGWLSDRTEGDRSSPIGVFALTDAGGALEDPGSLLPYTHEPALRSGAAAAYGADYSQVFDYVIAIGYNRVAGTPPMDDQRPLGWEAGGKIWLHVDHGSPTRGCITVEAEHMRLLLRTLDPAQSPHIIMGPSDAISV